MQVTLKHKDIVAGIALYLQRQGFATATAENLDVVFTQGRKDKNGLTAQVDIGDAGEARVGTNSLAGAQAQMNAATVNDLARAELSPVEKAKGERANTVVEAAAETPLTAGNAEVAQPVADQVAEKGQVDPVAPTTPETAAAVAESTAAAEASKTPTAEEQVAASVQATPEVAAEAPVEEAAPVAETPAATEAPAEGNKSLFG